LIAQLVPGNCLVFSLLQLKLDSVSAWQEGFLLLTPPCRSGVRNRMAVGTRAGLVGKGRRQHGALPGGGIELGIVQAMYAGR
jgi:hypothetical protein